MRGHVLLFILTLSYLAEAKVTLAFVVSRNSNGSIREYSKSGRFAHVAVSYRGRWLQAHPHYGVVLTQDLKDFGDEITFLSSQEYNEPSEDFVRSQLGTPFSYLKSWDDSSATYCSKLVAQAYNIKPSPMEFSAAGWKGQTNLPRGAMGSSADKLYQIFLSLGFKTELRSCAYHLF